jgi:uncharacterized protein YndB with AHSA1/START domain
LQSEPQTHSMTVTRIFDAPVEQAWRAWSEPEMLMRWWGPSGFSSPSARMDFREGGQSLVCMRAPQEYGGADQYNLWVYRRIVPLQRIEFSSYFADKDGNKVTAAELGLPPALPFVVPHVVAFKDLDGGRTELTVTEYGYPNEQIPQLSRLGMEQCLDKMEALLSQQPGSGPL